MIWINVIHMIQSHLITPNFAESPGSGRIGVIKSYTTNITRPLPFDFFFGSGAQEVQG